MGHGAWKGRGVSGLGWERGGNVVGAMFGKRWEGALGLEVVAWWDAGVHYFFRVDLNEIQHRRGR